MASNAQRQSAPREKRYFIAFWRPISPDEECSTKEDSRYLDEQNFRNGQGIPLKEMGYQNEDALTNDTCTLHVQSDRVFRVCTH